MGRRPTLRDRLRGDFLKETGGPVDERVTQQWEEHQLWGPQQALAWHMKSILLEDPQAGSTLE